MDKAGVPADASAVIYLAKAKGLAVARACLGPLLMSPTVWNEVVVAGARRGRTEVSAVEKAALDGDVHRVAVDGGLRRRARQLASRFGLGAGESEVLALGLQFNLVLLDEHRATRASRALGVFSIETAYVPAVCVQAGVLDSPAGLELLHAIGRHTTVRSELLVQITRLIEEVRP